MRTIICISDTEIFVNISPLNPRIWGLAQGTIHRITVNDERGNSLEIQDEIMAICDLAGVFYDVDDVIADRKWTCSRDDIKDNRNISVITNPNYALYNIDLRTEPVYGCKPIPAIKVSDTVDFLFFRHPHKM